MIDDYPFLSLRKKLLYFKAYGVYYCNIIASNPSFEALTILVIFFNS